VVLVGAGSAFCAGADFGYLRSLSNASPEDAARNVAESNEIYTGILKGLRTMAKPTIAAINGPAAGLGASLALACDLRYATSSAAMTFPFSRLGISPDGGATWTLPRLLGGPRALELLLTGEKLTPEEGLAAGLLNRVVPPEDLEALVREIATTIANGAPLAVATTKQAVRGAEDLSFVEAIGREFVLQAPLRLSNDFKEGLAAATERRLPNFSGS
jgi:enoyl-CoA hydratase/carnithine racemase